MQPIHSDGVALEPMEWDAGGQALHHIERIAELCKLEFPMLRDVDGELRRTGRTIKGTGSESVTTVAEGEGKSDSDSDSVVCVSEGERFFFSD